MLFKVSLLKGKKPWFLTKLNTTKIAIFTVLF